MNIFRFLGDMSHILSIVILLHKIVKGKSAAGISLRTQEMFLGAQALPLLARARLSDAAAVLLPPCSAAPPLLRVTHAD